MSDTTAPEAAPAHQPKAPTTGYISNPFGLVEPSIQAFSVAALTLIKLILFVIALILALAVPLVGLGFLEREQPLVIAALVVAGFIGFVMVSVYTQWMFTKVLAEAAHGRSLSFTAARPAGWGQAFKLFWTNLLAGLAIVGGFFLFVIPGVIFSLWFAFVGYVVVVEGLSGTAALRRSRELARGRMWDVFGTMSLINAIALVTLIPLIGTWVYIVMAFVLVPIAAVRYRTLVELKSHDKWQETPTSSLNYLSVVLAVVYVIASSYISIQDVKKQAPVDRSVQVY